MKEEQLHAYVDGLASEEDRRAVEAELSRGIPMSAARLRAYTEQNRALHEPSTRC